MWGHGRSPAKLAAQDLPHAALVDVLDGCLEHRPDERLTFAQLEPRLGKIAKEMEEMSRRLGALREFLAAQGMAEHVEALVADGVEGCEDLVHLDEEDLKALGLSKIKSRKVLHAIAGMPAVHQ